MSGNKRDLQMGVQWVNRGFSSVHSSILNFFFFGDSSLAALQTLCRSHLHYHEHDVDGPLVINFCGNSHLDDREPIYVQDASALAVASIPLGSSVGHRQVRAKGS